MCVILPFRSFVLAVIVLHIPFRHFHHQHLCHLFALQLLYTTSTSVNGRTKPALLRPSGPIYQVIDAVNLKARNIETTPFFNQVSKDP